MRVAWWWLWSREFRFCVMSCLRLKDRSKLQLILSAPSTSALISSKEQESLGLMKRKVILINTTLLCLKVVVHSSVKPWLIEMRRFEQQNTLHNITITSELVRTEWIEMTWKWFQLTDDDVKNQRRSKRRVKLDFSFFRGAQASQTIVHSFTLFRFLYLLGH